MNEKSTSVTISLKTSQALKTALDTLREQTGMSNTELLAVMIDRWNHPRTGPTSALANTAKDSRRWAGPAGANRPAKLDPASAGAGVVGDFAHLANLDELANENHVRAQMGEPPRTPQESGLEVQEQIEEEELEALRESLDREIEDGAAADARNARPRKTGRASTRAAPASEELQDDLGGEIF